MASKKVKKEVKKFATKNPTVFTIILIFLLFISMTLLIIDYYNIYDLGIVDSVIKDDDNDDNEIIVSGDLTVTFLETGNEYSGDAIYIKAGETDVLIDAGSRKSSSITIKNYIDKYVNDNTLEYVIATHAHQDHIAGFVGTKTEGGIFDFYDVKTIIDFPMTNATSDIYKSYVEKRTTEINNGAKHYTALECYNNENGASRVINLTEDVTLEILYNYYYENKASNENNYSVCVMISHGNKKILLTGDLEEEGEEKLVKYNNLTKVNVFKAGHHGSYTATTNELLQVIQPDIVCVCCCAGHNEYKASFENIFPSQAFISRVSKYTDRIYVTTLMTDNGFISMNGNIVITSNNTGLVVNCSNNNTILKDTEWFKKNREWE